MYAVARSSRAAGRHVHQLTTPPPPQDADKAIVVTINPEKPRKGCLYAPHCHS